MLTLIVGQYREPVAARAAEIASALRANLENPAFDRVIVVVEDELCGSPPSRVDDGRCKHVFLGERMTYAHAFELAHAPRWWGGAFVLANSDIEFDHTIELARHVPRGALWCVSRTDPRTGKIAWNPAKTQDAWIFRVPLPRFPAGFKLGVPGCDNRIAYEAKRAGLALSNPARRIVALHRHESAIRRVNSVYGGPSEGVPLDPPDQGD